MKNAFDVSSGRLDEAEEKKKISELGDMSPETSQTEKKKDKRMKNNTK